MNKNINKNELIEALHQKEKELFNPILSGSTKNNTVLEFITKATLRTLESIQQKKNSISYFDLEQVIKNILTSWELREQLKKKG